MADVAVLAAIFACIYRLLKSPRRLSRVRAPPAEPYFNVCSGKPSPNKTDAGNGSYGICRVIDASRSPSPDPKRSATARSSKPMRAHPFRIGGLAALLGILAWSLEWRLELHALNPIVLCAKVLALIALVFCVRHVAPPLFRSWRPALVLWLMLSVSSIAALFAAIPFRLWMPRWTNDGLRRWYYEGMPQPEGDYPQWLADWHRFGPHLFEAAVLLVFFALLLAPCVLFRIRLWSSVLVCSLGYALLAIAPVSRDLLAFDYDTFHLGIALDSIALSLWPMGLGYSDAHTIFTLGFLAFVFTVARVFLALPLAHPNDSTTPTVS